MSKYHVRMELRARKDFTFSKQFLCRRRVFFSTSSPSLISPSLLSDSPSLPLSVSSHNSPCAKTKQRLHHPQLPRLLLLRRHSPRPGLAPPGRLPHVPNQSETRLRPSRGPGRSGIPDLRVFFKTGRRRERSEARQGSGMGLSQYLGFESPVGLCAQGGASGPRRVPDGPCRDGCSPYYFGNRSSVGCLCRRGRCSRCAADCRDEFGRYEQKHFGFFDNFFFLDQGLRKRGSLVSAFLLPRLHFPKKTTKTTQAAPSSPCGWTPML